MIAPAGLNPKIVDVLNKQIRAALQAREVQDALTRLGFELEASTPAAFTAFIKAEHAFWGKFIKERNIRVQ